MEQTMHPILLYGFPSGTSLGLIAALEWLGQPYDLCRVDMLGEMRDPSYARLNPRHETPVLITDDGRPISETVAIAAYLEARDPDRRISFEPRSARSDRMHQLIGFLNTGFTGAFGPLWAAMEMETPDPDFQAALRRFGRAAVIERHDKLEDMVGESRFLVGDTPCLADALLAGVARWLEFHEVADIGRWPKLRALRQRVEADPAVLFATALENGDQPPGNGTLQKHVLLTDVISQYGR